MRINIILTSEKLIMYCTVSVRIILSDMLIKPNNFMNFLYNNMYTEMFRLFS